MRERRKSEGQKKERESEERAKDKIIAQRQYMVSGTLALLFNIAMAVSR